MKLGLVIECEDAIEIVKGKKLSEYPEWFKELVEYGTARKSEYAVWVSDGANGWHYAPNGSLLVRMRGPAIKTGKGTHCYQVVYGVIDDEQIDN